MPFRRLSVLTLSFLTLSFSASAAEPGAKTKKTPPPDVPAYTTRESAGADFAAQGEYEGTFGAHGRLGADVIALGEDRFHVVFHRGGLPGAGWDGAEKIEADGRRQGETIVFDAPWQARVARGALTGTTDTGERFDLKRVERHSPTEGAKPPAGALVLFDGSNTTAWINGTMDERSLLGCGTKSKQAFRDFTLHLEFILPFKPLARGQARGNSGVYLQDRYEVQVLDSFGLKGADNECGGIYKHDAPKVNLCYPPLQWQTYDIDFTAARFDAAGLKTHNAVVTVKHNGIAIHDRLALKEATPGGGFKTEVPAAGPFHLQQHRNPVFYRNIWVLEK